MVFEASVEVTVSDNSGLILNGIKKPSNIHALSIQLSSDKVTHSGMNQMTAAVSYIGQHVGWCDRLVTQNSGY
jgi:hypothetical protein